MHITSSVLRVQTIKATSFGTFHTALLITKKKQTLEDTSTQGINFAYKLLVPNKTLRYQGIYRNIVM